MSIQEPPEESIPPDMSIQEPSEESIPNPFICDCEEHMRQACASEGFYKEKEGRWDVFPAHSDIREART